LNFVLLTLTIDCRAGLDLPGAILNFSQLKRFQHFAGLQREFEVLFVCENKHGYVGKLFFIQELLDLFVTFRNALLIRGVDDENNPIRAIVVILPVGSDGLLTTDVPHVQFEAFLGLFKFVRVE